MDAPRPSYLIVGAGNFGASTAWHLRKTKPTARITLLDRTPYACPYGASHDINKVVRDYYPDIFHMRLASEAQSQWRSGDLWKPFYHESGLFNAEATGLGRHIIENYGETGIEHDSKMVSPDEIKSRWKGKFKDARWYGVKKVYWKLGCGWVDAAGAVAKMVDSAVQKGVEHKEGRVSKLLVRDSTCHGVQLADESIICADRVILCVGAHLPKLLLDSVPKWKDLHTGDRVTAVGVVTGFVRLKSSSLREWHGLCQR